MSELHDNIRDLLKFIVDKGYKGVVWKDGIEPPLSADYLNISEEALRDLLKVDNTSSDGVSDGGIIQKILYFIQQEVSIREQLGNDLNNSIDDISDVLTQLNIIIEEQLKPKDDELSNKINNINTNLSKKIDTNMDSISDNSEKILKLANTSENLTKDINDLNNSVDSMSDVVNQLNIIIEEQLKPQDSKLSNEINNINDNLSEKIDTNAKSISDNSEKILKLTTASENLTKDVTELKSDVLTLSEEVDSLSNNMSPEIDTTNIIMNNDEVVLYCGSSTQVVFRS